VIDQVNQWTDIMNGPYATTHRMELKKQIKRFLRVLTRDEPDDRLLMLYFVVLCIRNPASALWGTSSAIREIIKAVFEDISHKIYSEGTLEQRQRFEQELYEENNYRERMSERAQRLREIIELHDREMYLHYQLQV
jgi:hypothetical protein